MARLVTLDVTNTCIRVTTSPGFHFVSTAFFSGPILCFYGVSTYVSFPQAKIGREFDLDLDALQLDSAFRYIKIIVILIYICSQEVVQSS